MIVDGDRGPEYEDYDYRDYDTYDQYNSQEEDNQRDEMKKDDNDTMASLAVSLYDIGTVCLEFRLIINHVLSDFSKDYQNFKVNNKLDVGFFLPIGKESFQIRQI